MRGREDLRWKQKLKFHTISKQNSTVKLQSSSWLGHIMMSQQAEPWLAFPVPNFPLYGQREQSDLWQANQYHQMVGSQLEIRCIPIQHKQTINHTGRRYLQSLSHFLINSKWPEQKTHLQRGVFHSELLPFSGKTAFLSEGEESGSHKTDVGEITP